MGIGSLRARLALRTVAVLAVLVSAASGPAAVLSLADCAPAAAMPAGCCAADGPAGPPPPGCEPEAPMPCCRITRPAPPAPALLTAAPPPPALAAVVSEPSDSPRVPSRDAAARVAPRARSAPLFLAHSSLLI